MKCRDECQMALKRCQPEYYCEKVVLFSQDPHNDTNDNNNATATTTTIKQYAGGNMRVCPAGTYRDLSYHQVSILLSYQKEYCVSECVHI